MTWRLIEADCISAMQQMEDSSVDAIVTDPPYGLEFMGKEWDRLDWRDGGGFSSPVIGERATQWTSYGGETANPTCATCGGRARGQKRCSCAEPAWRVKGEPMTDPSRDRSRMMQDWHGAWATEALRVLKPGGHLLAFGGTRTYHRLACAIEDAGFEIRDCLAWMYGSGFPKSLDVSKAIDKAGGVDTTADERWVATPHFATGAMKTTKTRSDKIGQATPGERHLYAPSSEDAEQWQGWGTALKPAFEPIVLARKPLVGTVAANVLEHGTGALNIDGTRIGFKDDGDERESKDNNRHADFDSGPRENRIYGADERARGADGNYDAPGRWPANVVLDEVAAALLDEQTGESSSRIGKPRTGRNGEGWGLTATGAEYDDFGGASRFFYVAKSASAERNRGLEHRQREVVRITEGHGRGPVNTSKGDGDGIRENRPRGNTHPTVKPVELMQWLCRLVCPPNGTVLDPFTGSGSTGIAALREGFSFIGIEREHEYVEIARDRIIGDAPLFNVSTEVT